MGQDSKKKTTKLSKKEKEKRRIAKLTQRGRSDFVEIRDSDIHGHGVYAVKVIPKEEYFIEYVGNLIDKKESTKRAWAQYAKHEKTGAAAVYIFNLSKKWDLDGDVDWNPARLINHSCEPNAEAIQHGKRIYLQALREIQIGEEITFDYGFEAETYADHPCHCGSPSCIGFIVGRDYHHQLAQLIAEEIKEKARADQKSKRTKKGKKDKKKTTSSKS